MKYLILAILFLSTFNSLLSWPGDQASLSCIPGLDGAADPKIRDDINDQFFSRNIYATTNVAQQAINKQAAIDRVKTIVKSNHDRDFTVTKLGDSLSDLVDFYGVAIPRKVFPNYGDAAGTFGRLPALMDSWSDYMTAGAGILDPNSKLNFQNFGKSGNTTLSTMNLLGIDIQGDRENWNIASNATRCVKPRALEIGMIPFDYHEGISKEQSSMRSTLMIGGNDVLQSNLGFNGWLPFLNKYQVDSSLMNVMAITDWHIENGKQIFLEGTLPVLSHPARNPYNTALINRQTLCKPLNDLVVDLNEIPWYVVFFPGIMNSIIDWNRHVIDEITKFHADIFNPKPDPNYLSHGGFIEGWIDYYDEKIDSMLDGIVQIHADYNLAISPNQREEFKRQLWERRTSPDKQYNDVATRILFTTSSIAQACLNDRIKNNMLPLYKEAYPNNVDGYPLYSHFNQTGDDVYAPNFWVPEYTVYRQSGFFLQGTGFWDAIHIGPEGYKRWGILVGSKISELGYHTPGDPNTMHVEVALEANDAWGIIRLTSRNVGIIGMEATLKGVTVAANGKDHGGYYRQYTEGSGIYLKLYTSNTPEYTANQKYKSGVIHLPPNVNRIYHTRGGPSGELGFPLSGSMCWGPGAFCNYKLTLFEKGFIQIDETPIIGGGVTIVKAVNDVPDDKKNEYPDFDTCVSNPCGSRWFEHNKVYLQPISGKPPFTFQLMSGNLPPGFNLTSTGLLYGGPTNIEGTWTFRVMIIDSKGGLNSKIKDLTFTTGP